MTPQSTSNRKSIDNFTASKQLELFKELKEKRFSGEVVFGDRLATQWTFYLYLGRVVYTTGGEHPVRRWRRNLAYYFPQIVTNLKSELEFLQTRSPANIIISWDYYLLCLWVEQQKVDREQAIKMIRAVATEVLFDIARTANIDYYLQPQERALSKHLVMIDCEREIVEAWKLLHQWQETVFADYSPNFAPLIKQPETLQKKGRSTGATYQTLSKLLKGKYTFRDLAVQKQTSLLLVARSLTPYFRLGCMAVVSIPDLPNTLPGSPIKSSPSTIKSTPTEVADAPLDSTPASQSEIPASAISATSSERPLASKDLLSPKIACIDSNSLVRQIMKKIITSAGYQYISDRGSLNTSSAIKESQPDLIFINIELAEFSGYELCSLIRQIDALSGTPVILYSKKIGLVDRVKAKMVGCSELIEESLETKTILHTVAKYLPQSDKGFDSNRIE